MKESFRHFEDKKVDRILDQEGIQKEMESMMNNRVNIDFLKDQVSKLQKDVEELKDKIRASNNGSY